MTSVRWFAVLQALISAGLISVLWVLYARLGRRPFFKWWAWAWTLYAAYLLLGAMTLPLSAAWSWSRGGLVFAATVCAFLQPTLLVFGAMSLHSSGLLTRTGRMVGIAAALVAATVSFGLSLSVANPIDSFCVRLAPRALSVAGAALFCVVVLLRHRREAGSGAYGVAGLSYLVHALVGTLYGVAATGRLVAGSAAPLAALFDQDAALRPSLFLFDIVSAYGICLGMVLLLIEDFQRSTQALEESLRFQKEALDENAVLQAEISERRRVESALRLSEAKFAAAFKAAPCGVAISTLEEGHVLEINDACEAQTGYRRTEIIGRTTGELGLWIDPTERAAIVADLRELKRVYSREVRWRSKGGEERTILFSADTITVRGQPYMLSVALDITAHKQVDARHRAILRALPDWTFLVNTHGVFLDCHVKDRRFLLAQPEAFIGRNMREVLPPGLAGDLIRLFDRVARTDEAGTLEYVVAIDGEARHYETRAVRCDHDKVLSIVRDVTEMKRAEHQARELRQELAHIGRVTTLAALTGSLAHEIRQPLAAIRTNAQAAGRILAQAPALTELRDALTDIVADSQRAADVLQRVSALLKRDTPTHAAVDLNAAVQEVVRVLRADLLARRISLTLDLEPDLPPVMGDRVQLQQVALNLLMNACDAVEDRPDEMRSVLLRTTSANSSVTVLVSDRGAGLTDEQLDLVFEPFYTTKATGMGLGLPICEMIMNFHDGILGVERNAVEGVTFSFALPVLSSASVPVRFDDARDSSEASDPQRAWAVTGESIVE